MHCNVNALDVHCAHMSASIKSCGTRRQLRGQCAARKEEETELLAWIYLALAAFFEVVFAMAMKYSHGFSRLVPTVIVVVGTVGGIGFLTMALKTLPVSVAYPIWTGIGMIGTVTLGYLWLGETLSPLKIVSITAILLGVAGLRATV